MASWAAYAFSNQKTQVKWRVGPHVNSRTKPLARFLPNNRSRERLFGGRARKEPFRSFTSGPTHQKRRVSWFESAYARVFATSEGARGRPCAANPPRGGVRAGEHRERQGAHVEGYPPEHGRPPRERRLLAQPPGPCTVIHPISSGCRKCAGFSSRNAAARRSARPSHREYSRSSP